MNKPVIGLTASHDQKTGELRMSSRYTDALRDCGAVPLVLPLSLKEGDCIQLPETLDGLLCTGGPDVHPFRFGEETLKGCGDFSPLRDEAELLLFHSFYKRKKPILGICRGIQLINIALGGDIYQDLDAQLSDRPPIAHRQPFRSDAPSHHVDLASDSQLARISQAARIPVNSLHHQAVRRPAESLRIAGQAPDGVIEALEQPDYPFLIGVQWHPEWLYHTHDHARKLFEAFAAACAKHSMR